METTAALAQRYFAAWSARDPDAVASLHAADSRFVVHGDGTPARGRDGMRVAAAGLFGRFPGFAFEERRLLLGDRHWVLDWTLRSDATPDGVALVDVVELDDAGLVRRKDTFLAAAPAPTT